MKLFLHDSFVNMFIVLYLRRFHRNNLHRQTMIIIFYFANNNVKLKTFFIQILIYRKIFRNKNSFVLKKEIYLHRKI